MVNITSKKRRRAVISSSEDESEYEYQVEAILDKRVRRKKIQYLLKWKGYSNADNSWEDENRLNCPDLVKDFEEHLKKKNNQRKSPSKSKNTNMQESDEDYQSDENQTTSTESDENQTTSTESDTDSTKNDDNNDDDGDGRIITRHSPRKKARLPRSTSDQSPSTRRHSKRKIVKQTKFRITSMSKDESSNDEDDDIIEEESLPTKQSEKKFSTTPKIKNTTIEDNNNNNNNSIDFSDKSPAKEINTNEPTTMNTRFRVIPSSTSSISLVTNDNNNEKASTECNINDQNTSEIIDETDQVETIEAVRNNQEGISFRIKLINDNEAHWISSKIANRKYPQAIIAFWENHVEFT